MTCRLVHALEKLRARYNANYRRKDSDGSRDEHHSARTWCGPHFEKRCVRPVMRTSQLQRADCDYAGVVRIPRRESAMHFRAA
jgi:hypothetical protein